MKNLRLAALAAALLCSCNRSPSQAPAAVEGKAGFAKLTALQQSCRGRVAEYGRTFSAVDQKFAGVRAYGKALQGLDASQPWDLEALTVKNPDYWRATMEMVPQEPSVTFSNAYLCAMSGRLDRAKAWLMLGSLGMEPQWAKDRDDLGKGIAQANAEIEAEIKKGIALHDAGKYKEALAAYDAILAGAPHNTWALYERSYALLASDEKGSAAAREDLYHEIRELNPFYAEAYQGTDHDVINRRLPRLLKEVLPFVQGKADNALGLGDFAQGSEQIGIHDFAALAYWKLLLSGGQSDQMMSHFFFNLKRLGLDPFVQSVAGAELLKLVAELDKQTPKPGAAHEARILEYGLFRLLNQDRGATPGGRAHVVVVSRPSDRPSLTETTDRVPARRGVLFGYSFEVPSVGAGLRSVIRHPPMACPGLAASSESSFELPPQKTETGFAAMLLYGLDADCELLKGRWTLQVRRQDEVVLSKDFELIDAPAALDAGLTQACGNEISMLCQDAGNDSAAVKGCLLKYKDGLTSSCRAALAP